MSRVRDTRIVHYEPLLSPAALLDELPLGAAEDKGVPDEPWDVTACRVRDR